VERVSSRAAVGKKDPSAEATPEEAYKAALALLARRDFSSLELKKRLESRGFDADVASATIAELQRRRLLNDSRFAESYVAAHVRRGHGPVRIAADLKALGLPAETINAALDSGPDWPALARQARARRFGPRVPATWAERARQARFLQYRGFSSDHIRAALGPDFDPDESP